MRLVGLCRLKFDGDIIEEFARHTLRFVDDLYIVENATFDATRSVVESLQSEGLPITLWSDDHLGIVPAIMTDLTRRVLRETGADFAVVLDADEFLRVASREALEARLHAVPEGAHARVPWQTHIPVGRADPSKPLLEQIPFRRRAESTQYYKVLVNRSILERPAAVIELGVHSISDPTATVEVIDLEGVALAHFPVRSIPQVQGKALLGWSAFLSLGYGEENDVAFQWHRLYRRLYDDQKWPDSGLTSIAVDYLCDDGRGLDLVFDPVPPVERQHAQKVPSPLQAALYHLRYVIVELSPAARPAI